MPLETRHYALVVGIDDYPRYRSLSGAKNDAQDFAEWVKDTDIGGGVPDANLKLVLSKTGSEVPVQNEIDDALHELMKKAKTEGADRLYIYFAGHGIAYSVFSNNLCLANWSKERTGAALSSENYLESIKESGIFNEIVLFLDCCRTQKVGKNALSYQYEVRSTGDNAANSRTFVGYATSYTLPAHEASLAESEDEDLDEDNAEIRGHFTRALIEALKGAAALPTGGVTATDLKEYLDRRTKEIAQSNEHHQKPEVVNGLDGDGVPLFGSAVPKGATVKISFQDTRTGTIRLENGRLDILKEGLANSGPWLLPGLDKGKYSLIEIDTEEEGTFKVLGTESEGDIIDVQF